MYKFKIKILYSKGYFFCTKTELLNFKLLRPFAKSVRVGARLTSNGLISLAGTPVGIQPVPFIVI